MSTFIIFSTEIQKKKKQTEEMSASTEQDETKLLDEADMAVASFIAENIHSGSVTQEVPTERSVREFVEYHRRNSDGPIRFALATGGGTVAPLERQEIRHITNLSTGKRGATSCEWLLREGYCVVYFHKTGSLLPFSRHFQDGSFMDSTTIVEEADGTKLCRLSSTFNTGNSGYTLTDAVTEYQKYCVHEKRCLHVPFHTVADYQLGMRTILETFRKTLPAGEMKHLLVYLVAAVADFYIPFSLLPKEKIDSKPSEDSMTVYLHKVPKALARGLVARRWGDGAFVTTFKLETDETRVNEKVMKHINAFANIRVVVANLLQTCRTDIDVYDTRDPANPLHIKKSDGVEIEEPLVKRVVAKHQEFREDRW